MCKLIIRAVKEINRSRDKLGDLEVDLREILERWEKKKRENGDGVPKTRKKRSDREPNW